MQENDYSLHIPTINANKIICGIVVEKNSNHLLVDIGSKSEAYLPFSEIEKGCDYHNGDSIKVVVLSTSAEGGDIYVSQKEVAPREMYQRILDVYNNNLDIKGTVTKQTESGFVVQLSKNFNAFLPLYLADVKKINPPDTLVGLVGQEIGVKIYKIRKENQELRIFVSRRDYLLDQLRAAREHIFENKKEEDIIEGKVVQKVSYGWFVDIGGVNALLHNTEISWSRYSNINKLISLNKKIRCKIIYMDALKKRVAVSLKQVMPNPWLNIEEKIRVGSVISGVVLGSCSIGLFIEVMEGVSGLLHISNISWFYKYPNPATAFKVGESIDLKVLAIHSEEYKISLGYKQLQEDPLKKFLKQYQYQQIKATINKIDDHGIFVTFPPHTISKSKNANATEGFLHLKDLYWLNDEVKITHFKSGDEIKVVVLDVITSPKGKNYIRVGYPLKYTSGTQIMCVIDEIKDSKIHLVSKGGLETYMHKNYLPYSRTDTTRGAKNKIALGKSIQCTIIKIDPLNRTILLSARNTLTKEQKMEINKYRANRKDLTTVTLNEIAQKREFN